MGLMVAIPYLSFMVTMPFSLLYSTLEPLSAISLRLRWQRTEKLQTTLLMTMSTSGEPSSSFASSLSSSSPSSTLGTMGGAGGSLAAWPMVAITPHCCL